MSSYDPEFHDQTKVPPSGYEPTKKRSGCWFYGCLFALVSGLIAAVGLGVGAFMLYRAWAQYVEEYTAVAPVALPKAEITEEERRSAVERASKFRDALKAKARTEPLVLSGDDLNALIQETPELKDHVYATIEDDTIKARVSLPIDLFFDAGLTRGRYLNGEAELRPSIRQGKLKLAVESISMDGKPLPDAVRDFFARPNVAVKLGDDSESLIHEIESFEIKGGRIVITPRSAELKPDRAPETPGSVDSGSEKTSEAPQPPSQAEPAAAP